MCNLIYVSYLFEYVSHWLSWSGFRVGWQNKCVQNLIWNEMRVGILFFPLILLMLFAAAAAKESYFSIIDLNKDL